VNKVLKVVDQHNVQRFKCEQTHKGLELGDLTEGWDVLEKQMIWTYQFKWGARKSLHDIEALVTSYHNALRRLRELDRRYLFHVTSFERASVTRRASVSYPLLGAGTAYITCPLE
jgi:hypothetical protein